MNIVADTHRLPYQRALLRAWSNVAKTEAVQFYNVTNPDSEPDDAVGFNVKTNAAGYLYTIDNIEISCLAVDGPAIIEVSLDNGTSWPIQWITGLRSETTLVTSDIHKLYFKDASGNTVAFDPLASDQTLPDYALKSDIPEGLWAEGTLEIDGDTSTNLTISAWTHSIYNSADRSSDVFVIPKTAGREGQVITVTNGYEGSTLKIRTTYGNTNTDTALSFGDIAILMRCDNFGWAASRIPGNQFNITIGTQTAYAQLLYNANDGPSVRVSSSSAGGGSASVMTPDSVITSKINIGNKTLQLDDNIMTSTKPAEQGYTPAAFGASYFVAAKDYGLRVVTTDQDLTSSSYDDFPNGAFIFIVNNSQSSISVTRDGGTSSVVLSAGTGRMFIKANGWWFPA